MSDPHPSPLANARAVVASMLGGAAPNGIAPDDCGEHGELVQALFDAHAAGGPAAVTKAFEAEARRSPDVARLRAGDDPLAHLESFTAAELQAMELPEPRFVVDGVIPEGTSLLAAAPKIGKTLLALGVSLAIAAGGRALGKIPVRRGRVLFLALEGSKRGMKRRIDAMLMGEQAPERLHIYREWPAIDAGGLDLLRAFLRRHPDTALVVIDTLKRIRGKSDARRSIYDTDYEALQPITALGEEMGTSFLVIHHTRKMGSEDPLDLVSGSTGLTGAVDNVLVMQKQRGQADAKLTVIPREEEEVELALSFDGKLATWVLEGMAAEIAKTAERQGVLDVLKEAGQPLKTGEIATALGKKTNAVSYLLKQMEEAGTVKRGERYGTWTLPVTPWKSKGTESPGSTGGA